MVTSVHWKTLFLAITLQRIVRFFVKFCTKTQNSTTMTVRRQKFLVLKIQDGGQICTDLSRGGAPVAYRLDRSGPSLVR